MRRRDRALHGFAIVLRHMGGTLAVAWLPIAILGVIYSLAGILGWDGFQPHVLLVTPPLAVVVIDGIRWLFPGIFEDLRSGEARS